MASVTVFALTRFTALAAGDCIPAVDVSDLTQSAHGSVDAITVTNFLASLPAPVNVTSASATSFAVGRLGATTPAFTVDSSTGSQVAGLKVTGAATGGTVAIVATDSGSNTNLIINAKGSGTIGIGTVSTGAVTITPALSVGGATTLQALTATTGAFSVSGAAVITAYRTETPASGVRGAITIGRSATVIGYIGMDGSDNLALIRPDNTASLVLNSTTSAALLAAGLSLSGATAPTHGIQFGTSAPGSLANGQIWYDGTDFKVRTGGATKTITIT